VAPSGTGSKSVVAGNQPELPGDVDEDQPPYDPTSVVFTTDASSAEVSAFYRGQWHNQSQCSLQLRFRRRHAV
jgi:hypothetical protein